MKNTDNANTVDAAVTAQVEQLYSLMQSEKLEELEIKEDDFYLYVKRKGKRSAVPAPQSVAAPVYEAVPAEAAAPELAGETVQSPIMGIFYRAPSPTSAPFVKEGDVVNPGKTLCIVEAMKVMNEIKADARLRIIKILVENGKSITSGQDLFLVEKA